MGYSVKRFNKLKRFQLWNYAKKNRKNPTKQEALVWKMIQRNIHEKNKPYFFYRQSTIEGTSYIFDFLCVSLKVIVEIDGKYHKQQHQRLKDLKRDKRLRRCGYKILRFDNEIVDNYPLIVIDNIVRVCDGLYEKKK